MSKIVVVEKLGSIKTISLKLTDTPADLYKKAGFKIATDFKLHHTFDIKSEYFVELYGKITGKASQENKYDFPPPMDNTLFFGNCILVCKNLRGHIIDMSHTDWIKIYEHLFGGFENIEDDDEDDDEEIDEEEMRILNDPTTKFTKEGYVKDDFIADDDDEDEMLDDDDDDDSEITPPPKKSKPKKTTRNVQSRMVGQEVDKSKNATKAPKEKRLPKNKRVEVDVSREPQSNIELQDELEEEEYFQ
uniref:Uncharacterized protein n=1 Tax=viral metagenome TaxID=1070528 RepID=A0A6C0IC29_9ZZZZ